MSALKFVSESSNSDEVPRIGRIGLDFGPEPLDVNVQGFGVTHVIGTPDTVDQLPTRHHPPTVAEQHFQQFELFEGKLDPLTVD